MKEFKKRPHGDLDWMMHSSKRLSFVIWKDKQSMLLLSTHALPITNGDAMSCFKPRRNGRERQLIPMSPIVVEYTIKICGVNMADQLRGNYSWLSRSYKWWHCVFLFLWEMTIINMYVMYLEILKNLIRSSESIILLQFQIGLAKALTHGWKRWSDCDFLDCPTNQKSIVLDITRSEEYIWFVAFAQIIIVIYAVKYSYV